MVKTIAKVRAEVEANPSKRSWSDKDDMILWRACTELGTKWKLISEERFNNTRKPKQIQFRWKSTRFRIFLTRFKLKSC